MKSKGQLICNFWIPKLRLPYQELNHYQGIQKFYKCNISDNMQTSLGYIVHQYGAKIQASSHLTGLSSIVYKYYNTTVKILLQNCLGFLDWMIEVKKNQQFEVLNFHKLCREVGLYLL